MDVSGHNSRGCGGLIAVRLEDPKQAKDSYYEDFLKKSMGNGDPGLAMLLAEKTRALRNGRERKVCPIHSPFMASPSSFCYGKDISGRRAFIALNSRPRPPIHTSRVYYALASLFAGPNPSLDNSHPSSFPAQPQ